jgi:hypothetical protein
MLVHKNQQLGSKMLFHQNELDEPNNPCGLKLAMVVVYNSNDEILLNINWEF